MSVEKLYEFTVKNASQSSESLEKFKGKVVLVVNVASKCGYTPQYEGLEALYKKFGPEGFVILGFPCNQFASQEPGDDQQIQSFCQLNYGVSFPVMAKIDVNGQQTEPLFSWLKQSAPGIFGTESIKWNFTKFLIGKDGRVLKRFSPSTEPKDLESEIADALKN